MNVVKVTEKQIQGKRLQEIVDALNLNQQRFSRLIQNSQSHVSRAIKGEKGISFGMLQKMLRQYPQININRIFTGLGPVLFSSEAIQTVEESQAPYGDPLSEARQHLKSALDLLDHCQKMPDDKEK